MDGAEVFFKDMEVWPVPYGIQCLVYACECLECILIASLKLIEHTKIVFSL